jgi:hypothetical protein
MKNLFRIASLALASLPATALTQQQKVTPPVATYWMSVETTSGLPIGAMGGGGGMPAMDIGRMMLGGGMESGTSRSMLLELGSQRSPNGAPAATHDIPAGLKMGVSLPLETPRQARRPEPREDGMPEKFDKPRGRMLIYWGCGEQAGPEQPYVVDFARMAQGELPQGLTGRRVNVQRGPSISRSRTYGDWPNERDSQRVPRDGSLRGEHTVKGNYSPDMRFALTDKYDFMEPVNLAMAQSGGGIKLSWNSVANAHGYFASAMGGKEGTEDVVYWSSSNSREFGEQLMTWLAPGEVARLVTEKVVLPTATTECIVPAQFIAAAPAAFVRFIAYGEEANFVHPPRPQNPKVEWSQEWTAKVRLKSTAALMLGEGGIGTAPRGLARSSESEGAQTEGGAAQGAAPDVLQDGIKIFKGLFGR